MVVRTISVGDTCGFVPTDRQGDRLNCKLYMLPMCRDGPHERFRTFVPGETTFVDAPCPTEDLLVLRMEFSSISTNTPTLFEDT